MQRRLDQLCAHVQLRVNGIEPHGQTLFRFLNVSTRFVERARDQRSDALFGLSILTCDRRFSAVFYLPRAGIYNISGHQFR